MAFAKLFTALSAVVEDVKSPAEPAFAHRYDTDNGKSGNGKKRKTRGGQNGPYGKKQCYQAQKTRCHDAKLDDSRAIPYHMQNTGSEHASHGFRKEGMHSYRGNAGYNNRGYRGQNYRANNNRTGNNGQEQNKKMDPHHRGRGRPTFRGSRPNSRRIGGDRKHTNDFQGFQEDRPRFMTQEFKDQNALMVDDRLLCRHFLWGKCVKGDDCQLEHVQGYNDLVKEPCKFYVQGFCSKGEICPYMHKSFPCKFFHKGKCSQGEDCRFSHEPLNEVTTQVLEKELKRQNDIYELAKKAEQESSEQPVNTDEPKMIDENKTPDILLRPLRPNFYKIADTNAEEEALCGPTEEPADDISEAVPPHADQAAQPTNLNHEEPVCYSVEAMLGPKLTKPFPSFFHSTPTSLDSDPLSSSRSDLVPYSVEAVLRSCKFKENPAFSHTAAPPTAQSLSYSPQNSENINNSLFNLETQKEKGSLYPVNKSQEKFFQSQSSLTGLISKTCPDLTVDSGDDKKQHGNMPETLKPARRAPCEVKLESHSPSTVEEDSASFKSKGDMKGSTHLPMGIARTGSCKSEGVGQFKRNSMPSDQTSTPKHPSQSKPHLPVLTSPSQTSFKPFCPTKLKDIKSSDSAYSVGRHIGAKRPPESHPHTSKTQSSLKLLGTQQHHHSNETTAECDSKMAHSDGSAVGCKNLLKRPFKSLFASPIAETLQPIGDPTTSPSPRLDSRAHSLQSAVGPDKASARSFLGLFAAPLSSAPLPLQPDYLKTSSNSQQSLSSVDKTSLSSDSKERACASETALSPPLRTDVCHTPGFLHFSPKSGNTDNSTERISQAKRPTQVFCPLPDSLSEKSTSPTPRPHSPSTTHSHQQLSAISPHKGSAVKAAANSVLKTLFLCLSPYQQDSVHSESEKEDKSSTECGAAARE